MEPNLKWGPTNYKELCITYICIEAFRHCQHASTSKKPKASRPDPKQHPKCQNINLRAGCKPLGSPPESLLKKLQFMVWAPWAPWALGSGLLGSGLPGLWVLGSWALGSGQDVLGSRVYLAPWAPKQESTLSKGTVKDLLNRKQI